MSLLNHKYFTTKLSTIIIYTAVKTTPLYNKIICILPVTPIKQFNSIRRLEPCWFAQSAVAGEPESILSGLPSPVKVKSRTKYDGEPQLALSEPTARFFAPLFIKKVEERKLFF
ncbi:MAG: hypothetical protein A2373_00655 [Candidatus Magasanikbacteria bacterium RIFOXYB1_FULL_40_15]|uniref:Uncharacterized protein n=1 Tax=Candidatus Magasanikbacteria bacterium RIFOXYB1_FULL_40_15 TaxID=1798697 RepID=A0A1F6NIV0_9BACT|nr:MAG: hypothetical protein A2373_00655 [Candidatus Magasanikbacteria bacterium RIFOXYB1_FULL_40_15]